MTYEEMLAGRGLKVGDQVVCQYRAPEPHQWWIHPFWVGVIEEVGRDKDAWNGSNTEEQYCLLCHAIKVRYLPSGDMAGFTQHDSLANLRQLHFGEVTESPYFGSDGRGRRSLWEFACRAGMGDAYADRIFRAPAAA